MINLVYTFWIHSMLLQTVRWMNFRLMNPYLLSQSIIRIIAGFLRLMHSSRLSKNSSQRELSAIPIGAIAETNYQLPLTSRRTAKTRPPKVLFIYESVAFQALVVAELRMTLTPCDPRLLLSFYFSPDARICQLPCCKASSLNRHVSWTHVVADSLMNKFFQSVRQTSNHVHFVRPWSTPYVSHLLTTQVELDLPDIRNNII